MAATKRTPFEIERDRALITQRYLRGETQQKIAEAIGMSRGMVAYDLAEIQKRWRTDTARNLDEAKARELAKIDELERTYWISWEESRQDKVQVSEETIPPTAEQVALAECAPDYDKSKGLPLTLSKTVTKREGQVGNATYLAGVQWCIDRRCKLLGLDAPTRQEIGGVGGQPITMIAVAAVAPRQVDDDHSS